MNDLQLPFHPIIPGMQALGLTKRGRPIWPVMGGNGEGGDDGSGGGDGGAGGDGGDGSGGAGSGAKANAVDQHGVDLGYPVDTKPRDMTVEAQANFYKHQQRRKDDKLKEYQGITPEEALRLKQESEERRRNGLPPDERALEDARQEAARTAAQEAASQWAPDLAEEIAARFIPEDEHRQRVMAGIDPMRFVTDGKFDRQGLIDHLTGLQAAFGGGTGAGNQPSQWGQGGGRPPSTVKQSDEGLAEAKRRGYIKD